VDFVTVPMPNRVRFLGEGGYSAERERACKELKIGEVYVISTLDIGRSSSTVDITEESGRPRGQWNTAMFEFLSWGFCGEG
jgi:hypothetical protein